MIIMLETAFLQQSAPSFLELGDQPERQSIEWTEHRRRDRFTVSWRHSKVYRRLLNAVHAGNAISAQADLVYQIELLSQEVNS